MRRLQIRIDEELDKTHTAEAALRHMARAALVREGLARAVHPNPIAHLIGDIDDDAGDIDHTVYGS